MSRSCPFACPSHNLTTVSAGCRRRRRDRPRSGCNFLQLVLRRRHLLVRGGYSVLPRVDVEDRVEETESSRVELGREVGAGGKSGADRREGGDFRDHVVGGTPCRQRRQVRDYQERKVSCNGEYDGSSGCSGSSAASRARPITHGAGPVGAVAVGEPAGVRRRASRQPEEKRREYRPQVRSPPRGRQ